MLKTVELMNKDRKRLSHNIEKCIGCGLCVDICRNLRKAIELHPIKESRNHKLTLKAELCTTCGLCAFNCPFGALEFKVNNEKVMVERWLPQRVRVRLESCIGCGECARVCPQGAIEVNSKIKVASNECIYCGLCEEYCPTQAIKVDLADRKVEINGRLCLFCGSCEQICPKGIIKMRCLSCLLSMGKVTCAERIFNLQVKSTVEIDEDLCIYCGRCELNCPTKSIKVIKPFEGCISIKTDKCQKNCGICMDFCPCGAIERVNGNLIIKEDVCIYCGACYRVCPQKAIDFERKVVYVIDMNGRPIIHV